MIPEVRKTIKCIARGNVRYNAELHTLEMKKYDSNKR